MNWTSGELAERFKGRVIGPELIELKRLENLRESEPDCLSFVRDSTHLQAWSSSRAGAALIASKTVEECSGDLPDTPGRALIEVESPDSVIVELLNDADPGIWRPADVHSSAVIDPTSDLGEGTCIGAHVSIGPQSTIGSRSIVHPGARIGAGVSIGAACEIHAGAIIHDRCHIADGVTIHSGAVIGADGFGYVAAPDGNGLRKVPHVGNVVIEEGVEIGANTCIDRGKFGATRIGAGTKIDNLVQIGHNCEIGRACLICGGVGISGSVRLGNGVTLAGGVGIADNRLIGDGASIAAGSGVMDDIPAGQRWGGYPAREARTAIRIIKSTEELPTVMRKVKRLLKAHETE